VAAKSKKGTMAGPFSGKRVKTHYHKGVPAAGKGGVKARAGGEAAASIPVVCPQGHKASHIIYGVFPKDPGHTHVCYPCKLVRVPGWRHGLPWKPFLG
jgi:hypothetical protein